MPRPLISQNSECLSSGDIERLLNDVLEPPELALVSAHLEVCEACQRRLDQDTAPQQLTFKNPDQQALWQELFATDNGADRYIAQRLASVGLLRQRSAEATVSASGDTTPESVRRDRVAAKGQAAPLIEGYDILEVIGSGGMGTVYAAQQHSLNRRVAVKTMRRSCSPEAMFRFRREAEAVGKLAHQHVLTAYDAGEANGQAYIVTELIDGADLGQLSARQGPLDVKLACDLIRQAALGLQAAHSAGLVHRDIKPSNLMLTSDGIVKVLDLGLAGSGERLMSADDGAEKTTVMGSLDYMAPEQASDFGQADARSDIYSLGCTLFTLLTGHPPFNRLRIGGSSERILAHAHDERPDASNIRDEVPAKLAELIQRMMSIDPNDRPQSAGDIVESLTAFCGADSGSPPKWRFGLTAMAGFGAALLVLSIIIIKLSDGTTIRVETDRPVVGIWIDDANAMAAGRELTGENTSSIPSADKGASTEEMQGSHPSATASVSDPLSVATIDKSTHPQLIRTLEGLQNPVTAFQFGPQADVAYAIENSGRVLKWNLSDGTHETIFHFQSQTIGQALEVSPDGKHLYFGGTSGFTKLNLETREREWTHEGSSFKWAANVPGHNLIAMGQAQSTWIFSTATGVVVQHARFASDHRPQFTRDGQRMVIGLRKKAGAAIVDRSGPEMKLTTFTEENFEADYVALSQDEKFVIAIDGPKIVMWDIATGEIVQKGHSRNLRPQAFIEPVGDTGMFLTCRGALRNQLTLWNPLSDKDVEDIVVQTPTLYRFVPSPDGRTVLTSDFLSDRGVWGGTLRLWQLP